MGGAATVVTAVNGVNAPPPLHVKLRCNNPLQSLSPQSAETCFANYNIAVAYTTTSLFA
jgi:hypothetical protein